MSGTGTLSAVIPPPASPIAGENGQVTTPWRAWFLVLERRTGGTAGSSPGDSVALIKAEEVARISADNALQIAIDAERAARIAGDDTLATADQTLSTLLSGVSTALGNEIVRAMNAEALLVPIAQLCTMWSQCDLSFLPTSDPGGNRPWMDGNHIAVGTSSIVPYNLTIEDGSGHWTLEGGGDWDWG